MKIDFSLIKFKTVISDRKGLTKRLIPPSH